MLATNAGLESDSLLRSLVDGTADAVFAKDLGGRYVMVNSAGARFLGRTAEEVLGKDDFELFAEETARKIVEVDRRVIASGRSETIEEIGTPGGLAKSFRLTKGA